MMETNLRYQVYGLNGDKSLGKPITRPLLSKERAYKYYRECVQCALVSIDEYGSIVDIIDKNTELIKHKNEKPKCIKRTR